MTAAGSRGMGARGGAGSSRLRWVRNAEAVALSDLPRVPAEELADLCLGLCTSGCRISALTVLPEREPGRAAPRSLLAVLARDTDGVLGLVRAEVGAGGGYPALTRLLPQAQGFEREIHERWGILPEGHPWLKPLRVHAAGGARGDASAAGEAGRNPEPSHRFFRVEGEGIHEVAVGPVHAGIIEPGHFRFQCSGEEVLHLEIQLGYQHRGAEALFLRSSPGRRLVVAESIAGDTAVGHALAWCQAWEALAGAEVPLGPQSIRGIALELERIANHTGDLGALCNDVGFLPGASWFGRLRGEFLNLLLELSGNRFGRGLLTPGGVRFGLSADERSTLSRRLAAAERDLGRVAGLVFGNTAVAARFEGTGVMSRELAETLGLVGPAARASGCQRDARGDHPAGIYRFAHVPVALAESGDVMGRAMIRSIEAQRSVAFAREQLAEMPDGRLALDLPPPRPDHVVVSLVEGWRGEIAHVAVTSASGALADYRFVDPSFHNWFGLAMAMRGGRISDFPLCNKSFNLSYAGHDL
jgi:Ni,Fe-hydrogenase III large subunit